MVYFMNLIDITLISPQYEYIYIYVELCEAALNYNMQHELLDSGSVCCIIANISIDSVLDIPSSSGGGRGRAGPGPVKDDVKQQQKICQRMNDICLKIVRLYV